MTLVYTFFRTLNLHHLERSIYSISKQTVLPRRLLFFDNNTDYSPDEIKATVEQHMDLKHWEFRFEKHRDPKKTASWCQNEAIRWAAPDDFVLMRADYIYDFDFVRRVTELQAGDPNVFATSWCWQMGYFLGHEEEDTKNHEVDLEPLRWRENPQNLLGNKNANPFQDTDKDSGSFCASQKAMELGDWYDEDLVNWGYWQSQLQIRMAAKGVAMRVIPEYLFFHMHHVCDRNFKRAREEVEACWARKAAK